MSSRATRSPEEEEAPETDGAGEDSFFDLLKQVAQAPSLEPASAPSSLVGQQLSHFKVTERLGAGGMGVVYRGEDARLRRSVALKVLPPLHANDRSRQQRLMREARSAAAVSHPNIAAIYEVGEVNGVAFIAMELLEGETLRSRLRDPKVAPAEVLRWALQIAQGLARAHQAGIVHRDLKPDNVMLCRDGLIKILDFGLAKPQVSGAPAPAPGGGQPPSTANDESAHETASRDGLVVGTPRYMSPEQAQGLPVDARSDVFSFGVMLLELCTGRATGDQPKMEAEVEVALRRRSLDAESTLRQGLLRVAARCLEPEPARRFGDGTALAAALQPLAREGESAPAVPVVAPPRSRWRRALGALAMLAVAAGLVAGGRLLAISPFARTVPGRPLVRRLTANPPENAIEDAALSADGKTLAYVDRRGLWLRHMDPVRTDAVKLPERFTPQAITWFPKGDELLVVGLMPGMEGSTAFVLSTGGKARQLEQHTLSAPRISPDGRQVAWILPEGIVVGPAGMDSSRVLVPLERQKRLDRGFDQLSWSPDGRRLAYLRFSVGAAGAEAFLEAVEVKSGRVSVLLSDPRLVLENGHGALSWAPDGRVFYALVERPPHESGATLWAVHVEPGTGEATEPPAVVQTWTGAYPAALTAGRGTLSYVLYESQVDVYLAELLEGGRSMVTPRRITLTDHNEQPSGWTRDSKAVLYMSDQDGSHDLFSQDATTGDIQALVAEPDSQTWPGVSPSGDELLYWQMPLRDDEEPRPAELLRMPLGGGKPVHILTTERATRDFSGLPPPAQAHFRCPAQGRTCVMSEPAGAELRFSSFDPKTGHAWPLLAAEDPGVGHGWDLSSGGDLIAMPFRNGRIRTIEVASHHLQDRIVDLACDLQFVAWAADNASLFATGICPGERPYKVFFVQRTHAPRVLWASSYAWAGHPTPSPDGKMLALAIKPFDNDVWLLSGL